jgi:hypothetical protein
MSKDETQHTHYGVKVGRWIVDTAPRYGYPPQHEIQVTCLACGAGNLRWIDVSQNKPSGPPDWKLYKIGNIFTGYRATLHECEGTDPA